MLDFVNRKLFRKEVPHNFHVLIKLYWGDCFVACRKNGFAAFRDQQQKIEEVPYIFLQEIPFYVHVHKVSGTTLFQRTKEHEHHDMYLLDCFILL